MNEIRQAETVMSVEVVWKNVKTGELLSGPARRLESPQYAAPGLPPPQALPGSLPLLIDPNVPPPLTSPAEPPAEGAPVPKPPPVLVQSVESYTPELGQSTTSSLQGNMDKIATQIVSMMESPW
jgi:hypothetical protein